VALKKKNLLTSVEGKKFGDCASPEGGREIRRKDWAGALELFLKPGGKRNPRVDREGKQKKKKNKKKEKRGTI